MSTLQIYSYLLTDDLRKIQKKVESFTIREIKRKCWKGLKEDKEVFSILNRLVESNWIRRAPSAKKTKGGRPSVEFMVNPQVLNSKNI